MLVLYFIIATKLQLSLYFAQSHVLNALTSCHINGIMNRLPQPLWTLTFDRLSITLLDCINARLSIDDSQLLLALGLAENTG